MTTIQQILDFATLYLDDMLASNDINTFMREKILDSLAKQNLKSLLALMDSKNYPIEERENLVIEYIKLFIDDMDSDNIVKVKKNYTFYYVVVGITVIGYIFYKTIKVLYN